MVAPATQLSPLDGARLAALFENQRCPFALARASSTPLHEILQWLALPLIQECIERIAKLQFDAHRAAAIETLRETIKKTDNIIEKRRAACAILRALNLSCRTPSVRISFTPPAPVLEVPHFGPDCLNVRLSPASNSDSHSSPHPSASMPVPPAHPHTHERAGPAAAASTTSAPPRPPSTRHTNRPLPPSVLSEAKPHAAAALTRAAGALSACGPPCL